MPYIRVGNKYYKNVNISLDENVEKFVLKPRDERIIIRDIRAGKIKNLRSINDIPDFDSFVYRPCHFPDKFERVINKRNYNRYYLIDHKPCEGDWSTIKSFLQHVFEEQYEVGLEYIQLLYLYPNVRLPMLCLVSKPKSTGKSTFLDLMRAIFQRNCLDLDESRFNNQFNEKKKGKLLITFEEIKFRNPESERKLKKETTALELEFEEKYGGVTTDEFFGKFLAASNHEKDFLQIDDEDNRYWVRKLKRSEKNDPMLLVRMKKEIPHFLYFLKNRTLKYKVDYPSGDFELEYKTRFYFEKHITWTPALRMVYLHNVKVPEIGIAASLSLAMYFLKTDEIKFQISDLEKINVSKVKFDSSLFRRIIKEEWGFSPVKNASPYFRIEYKNERYFFDKKVKGKYFCISISYLRDKYEELAW